MKDSSTMPEAVPRMRIEISIAGRALAWVALLACACSNDQSLFLDSGPTDSGTDPTDTGSSDTGSDSGEPIIEEDLDIPYDPPPGGDPDKSLLDLHYVPDGDPLRLMVFVHGGSWIGGDKSKLELAEELVPWFVDRGFAVAAPNFRLASEPPGPQEVTWADQATDLAFALAWLIEHGADYNIEAEPALLMGYSSGAHLVALLAADEHYLELAGLAHESLLGSISFDVHAYDVPYALELMQDSELEQNIELIEFLFGETVEAQLAASPSSYAPGAPDVPPALLISADPFSLEGSKGYIVFHATQSYWQLLQSAGHSADWQHYENETHASLVIDFGSEGDAPTEKVAGFLEDLPL
ncbi:MAG: alpha/beta hydrolase [Polyangia bacterium]